MFGLNLNLADHLALFEKPEDSQAGWNETGQHWTTFNGHPYRQLFEVLSAAVCGFCFGGYGIACRMSRHSSRPILISKKTLTPDSMCTLLLTIIGLDT